MEYYPEKREILVDKTLSDLDKLVLQFTKILSKYADYVIISGYVSILLGRSRATEDVDLFLKKISLEEFSKLYEELKKEGFWCINAEELDLLYEYLEEGIAIRFATKPRSVPNFEVKFPNHALDFEAFDDRLTAILPRGKLCISSLERHVAFKRYYLKSDKDLEDAIHIEEVFSEQLDGNKINKLKERLEEYER